MSGFFTSPSKRIIGRSKRNIYDISENPAIKSAGQFNAPGQFYVRIDLMGGNYFITRCSSNPHCFVRGARDALLTRESPRVYIFVQRFLFWRLSRTRESGPPWRRGSTSCCFIVISQNNRTVGGPMYIRINSAVIDVKKTTICEWITSPR